MEIKKQRVSAYHWPSSSFILEVMLQECYTIISIIARVLYNYCKYCNYRKSVMQLFKLLQLLQECYTIIANIAIIEECYAII